MFLSVGLQLSLECAHSAVAIFVAKIMVDRALVPAYVWRIGSMVSRLWRGSFNVFRSSVLWVVYNGQARIRCLRVWGGWRGQLHEWEGY
jgi:hypothetical protein